MNNPIKFAPSEDSDQEINLALSGGGLRASYFHLGVLFALADCGLLKNVSRISSVSGGSIVAALYLSELSRWDPFSDSDSQLAFVCALERRLSSATRKNMTIRALVSLHNYLSRGLIKTIRNTRIEREYMKLLSLNETFSDVAEKVKKKHGAFEIVINATEINNDHGVQLNAQSYGQYSLAKLVAASTAVPGIFEPIVLAQNGSLKETLVDGGVVDNQGILALSGKLKPARIIVSDASGKPSKLDESSHSRFETAMRANTVLMEIRRNDLLNTINSMKPPSPNPPLADILIIDLREPVLKFNPVLFDAISRLRTDLDYFSESERFSLIAIAYLSTLQKLKPTAVLGLPDFVKNKELKTKLGESANSDAQHVAKRIAHLCPLLLAEETPKRLLPSIHCYILCVVLAALLYAYGLPLSYALLSTGITSLFELAPTGLPFLPKSLFPRSFVLFLLAHLLIYAYGKWKQWNKSKSNSLEKELRTNSFQNLRQNLEAGSFVWFREVRSTSLWDGALWFLGMAHLFIIVGCLALFLVVILSAYLPPFANMTSISIEHLVFFLASAANSWFLYLEALAANMKAFDATNRPIYRRPRLELFSMILLSIPLALIRAMLSTVLFPLYFLLWVILRVSPSYKGLGTVQDLAFQRSYSGMVVSISEFAFKLLYGALRSVLGVVSGCLFRAKENSTNL